MNHDPLNLEQLWRDGVQVVVADGKLHLIGDLESRPELAAAIFAAKTRILHQVELAGEIGEEIRAAQRGNDPQFKLWTLAQRAEWARGMLKVIEQEGLRRQFMPADLEWLAQVVRQYRPE